MIKLRAKTPGFAMAVSVYLLFASLKYDRDSHAPEVRTRYEIIPMVLKAECGSPSTYRGAQSRLTGLSVNRKPVNRFFGS